MNDKKISKILGYGFVSLWAAYLSLNLPDQIWPITKVILGILSAIMIVNVLSITAIIKDD